MICAIRATSHVKPRAVTMRNFPKAALTHLQNYPHFSGERGKSQLLNSNCLHLYEIRWLAFCDAHLGLPLRVFSRVFYFHFITLQHTTLFLWTLGLYHWDVQKFVQEDLDSKRAPSIPLLYSEGLCC